MPDRHELEQLAADGRINPEAFAIRSEEASRLRDAVQKLPPQYRIVLVLRDMEGLTDEEVAEITGVRSGTVRVRLHRARLFVRKELMRMWMPRGGKRALKQTHLVRSFDRHAAKRCSQNCQTVLTNNWTILFAKSLNAT
jgi:RNA polymerase sigma-70 factor, ECF subfamily